MKTSSPEEESLSITNSVSRTLSGKVQVNYLTRKASREFNERMRLSNSAVVMSAKLVRRGSK